MTIVDSVKAFCYWVPWGYVNIVLYFWGSFLWFVGPTYCYFDDESIHCSRLQLFASVFFFLSGCILLIEIKVNNHECEQTGGALYIFGGGMPVSAASGAIASDTSNGRELDDVTTLAESDSENGRRLSINGDEYSTNAGTATSSNTYSNSSIISGSSYSNNIPSTAMKKEIPVIDQNSWLPLSVFFFIIGTIIDLLLGLVDTFYFGDGKEWMSFFLGLSSSVVWGLSSLYAVYILDADRNARLYFKANLRMYFIPLFNQEQGLSSQANWLHLTGWGDISFTVGSIFCLIGSFTCFASNSKNWCWLPFVAAGVCFSIEWTCHFAAAIRSCKYRDIELEDEVESSTIYLGLYHGKVYQKNSQYEQESGVEIVELVQSDSSSELDSSDEQLGRQIIDLDYTIYNQPMRFTGW